MLEQKMKDKQDEFEAKLSQYEETLEDFNKFKTEKENMIKRQEELEEKLVEEERERYNQVQDAERQKIQATEKLRKEMLYKIKETKANLLALNDEQL